MSQTIDLNELARIFSRRGEKVVVILPDSEPVVLLPLSEYEKITTLQRTLPLKSAKTKISPKPIMENSIAKSEDKLEAVDPLQGALPDDDQYFPEPLEN